MLCVKFCFISFICSTAIQGYKDTDLIKYVKTKVTVEPHKFGTVIEIEQEFKGNVYVHETDISGKLTSHVQPEYALYISVGCTTANWLIVEI